MHAPSTDAACPERSATLLADAASPAGITALHPPMHSGNHDSVPCATADAFNSHVALPPLAPAQLSASNYIVWAEQKPALLRNVILGSQDQGLQDQGLQVGASFGGLRGHKQAAREGSREGRSEGMRTE